LWRPIQQAHASNSSRIQHVLLISIDGMHALDLARYVGMHPNSTLATLSNAGVTYSNAFSSKPSNALPGLLAMVTGGSPRTTGVWYDDAYARDLSPPGSNCSTKGTEVVWDQSIDYDSTRLDGGGGIDPTALPLNLSNGVCKVVYPHQYLRVNTLLEVVKSAGGTTAWADDHPSYDMVNGPSGKGVDDLFTPEIAATDGTVSKTEDYDTLKVQAILNEIQGKDHTGTKTLPQVPTVFGMNFQAVNVAQRLSGDGYLDGQGTPSSALAGTFDFVDQSLGEIVAELSAQQLLPSTLIIITAKHGQAPIDPAKTDIVPTSKIPTAAGVPLLHTTQDDVALLWLTNQSDCAKAKANLLAGQTADHLASVLACTSDLIPAGFGDPTRDPRTPDVIGIPTLGVIYANTAARIAAHGGLSDDDTHVPLLVSNPELAQTTVNAQVQTTQIAPTILSLLGLDPQDLQAVVAENTPVLPWLPPPTTPLTTVLAAKGPSSCSNTTRFTLVLEAHALAVGGPSGTGSFRDTLTGEAWSLLQVQAVQRTGSGPGSSALIYGTARRPNGARVTVQIQVMDGGATACSSHVEVQTSLGYNSGLFPVALATIVAR
jgi:hypothetical protein